MYIQFLKTIVMSDDEKKRRRKDVKAGIQDVKGKKTRDKDVKRLERISGTSSGTVSRTGKRLGVVNQNATSPTTRKIAAKQEIDRQKSLATRKGQKLVRLEQKDLAKQKEETGMSNQPKYGPTFGNKSIDSNKSTFNNNDESRMMSRGNFGNRS